MFSLLGVATICHSACLSDLEGHLKAIHHSLEHAGDTSTRVSLVCSQMTKQADIDQASKIISSYGPRFKIHQTPVELSIGEARNWAAASLEARWIVSSDVDSRMPETYIGKLRNYLEQIDDERVAGVCGNIGVWRVSKYGAFEALWESMALVKRVHGGDSALISDQIKSDNRDEIKRTINKIGPHLSPLTFSECPHIQGYNSVLRSDIYKRRGWNEKLRSASDREMVSFVTKVLEKKIVYLPECQIYHDFDFTLPQIMQRKIIHAMWLQEVNRINANSSNNYRPRSMKVESWFLDVDSDHPSFPNLHMFPFNTEAGKEYLAATKIAFAYGSLRSLTQSDQGPVYVDHRRVK